MTKKLEIILSALIVVAVMAIFGFFAVVAHANPSQLLQPKLTAAASTTQTYITYGIGTTTLYYDTYGYQNQTKADNATVFFQFNATSTVTSPSVNMRVEYAFDLNNGINCVNQPTLCDWYPMSAATVANASTTYMTGRFADYDFVLATSSVDTGGNSTFVQDGTSTINQSLSLTNIPTRFIRVKFYSPAGGGKGAIWAAIQAVKQNTY